MFEWVQYLPIFLQGNSITLVISTGVISAVLTIILILLWQFLAKANKTNIPTSSIPATDRHAHAMQNHQFVPSNQNTPKSTSQSNLSYTQTATPLDVQISNPLVYQSNDAIPPNIMLTRAKCRRILQAKETDLQRALLYEALTPNQKIQFTRVHDIAQYYLKNIDQFYAETIDNLKELIFLLYELNDERHDTLLTSAIEYSERGDLEIVQQILNDLHTKATHNTAKIQFALGKIAKCRFDYFNAYRFFYNAQRSIRGNIRYIYETCSLGYDMGMIQEAEPLYRRAVSIAEKMSSQQQIYLTCIYNDLALLYKESKKFDKAEALFEQLLTICRQALTNVEDIASENLQAEAIKQKTHNTLHELAELHHEAGNYKKAEPLYHKIIETLEHDPSANKLQIVLILNKLANLHRDNHQLEKAGVLYQQVYHMISHILGPNHLEVANILANMAHFFKASMLYGQAENALNKALSIQEKALGIDHPEIAITLTYLAELRELENRYEEAEPLRKTAIEITEKSLGSEHPSLAHVLNNLAELYKTTNRHLQAKPLLLQSLTIAEKNYGQNHLDVAVTLGNLARIYKLENDYSQAEQCWQKTLKIKNKLLGHNHPSTAKTIRNIAEVYCYTGKYNRGKFLLKKALSIFKDKLGKKHSEVATTLNSLAMLHKTQKHYWRAEFFYKQSLRIKEHCFGINHISVAITLSNIANLYKTTKRYKKAEQMLKRALLITKKNLGHNNFESAKILSNLGHLYEQEERYEEAESLYEQALETIKHALGSAHPDYKKFQLNLATLRNKIEWEHTGFFQPAPVTGH